MMTGAGRWERPRRGPIAVGAVVIAATAAALVPPPAAITDAAGDTPRAFAALASAALVTIAILPFIVGRSVVRPQVWAVTAALSLALGLAAFPAGGYAQRRCTTSYGARSVVIGTELTPLGGTYQQAHPELSSEDFLLDAAGVPQRIWTESSISRCTVFLSTTYFLWIPFLAMCLVATAQAVPASILAPIRWGNTAPPAQGELPILYDVFVSYRHEGDDQRFARDLLAELERDGYRVAIDERDFPANASFLQEMERAIRQSRFTVAVISRRYLESGNTEEEAVITKVLDMRDRKRRLVPVVIEPVTLPVWLYGIVGIDWTKRDPLVNPFEKLKATLGPAGSA
jgi:hypothetical protein